MEVFKEFSALFFELHMLLMVGRIKAIQIQQVLQEVCQEVLCMRDTWKFGRGHQLVMSPTELLVRVSAMPLGLFHDNGTVCA
jgi:hypothetical protein